MKCHMYFFNFHDEYLLPQINSLEEFLIYTVFQCTMKQFYDIDFDLSYEFYLQNIQNKYNLEWK